MEKMNYKYWLPGADGTRIDYTTDKNAIIIVGANGSGKSKLGAWIEQQELLMVHRIGAQRSLNYNPNLTLKSYEESENNVFFGEPNANSGKGARWNYGREYTTRLLNDFDSVLVALIARSINEIKTFAECCSSPCKLEWPDKPETSVDTLISIWNEVFPQRILTE